MVGQGSPKASRALFPLVPWALARLGCAALAWHCATSVVSPSACGAEVAARLRLAWGGGAERIWQGSIHVSDGQLAEVQPLGIEADEPGSIWLGPQGIEIHQRSVRAYDGLDFLVKADLDARLTIALSD